MFWTTHPTGGPGGRRPGMGEGDVVEDGRSILSHKTRQDCHSGILLQSKPYPAARSSFRLGMSPSVSPRDGEIYPSHGLSVWTSMGRLTDTSSANLDFDGGAVGC